MLKLNLRGMPTLRSLETQPETNSRTPSRLPIRTLLLLIGFSVFYFTDVCLRASEKYLWFDEIYTLYQSRLSLHGLWGALQAGFDFNPPLVYLLTKASNAPFGEGLITTRLPEILGFWIFCVCLFRFVSKRAGPLAGFSAMVLPMATGAFYYAYDARPPGLVLGFCGLALVAWQRSLELRRQNISLTLFSLALFAACMTHCYAITLAAPFGIAELVRGARSRRVEYRRWAALVAPVLFAAIAYLPLLHAYRETEGGTVWLDFSPVQLGQIGTFYGFLLTPCVLIISLIVALLAVKQTNLRLSSRFAEAEMTEPLVLEMVLAAGFVALPVVGLILALSMHSPFYDRYFVQALAGFCIFAGLGVGVGKHGNWIPLVLAGAMALWLVTDVSSVLWNRSHGQAETLVEPSSGFSLNSSLKRPLANYEMVLAAAKKGERIVVLWPMDFLYLVNYAPELRSQLYYIGWNDDDVFYRILVRLHPYVSFQYHTVTPNEFYASRNTFMFFGVASDPGQLHVIAGGIILKSLQFSNGRFLAEAGLKPSGS